MVRPSSRFAYALRALVDLALRQASGPVTVAAIARRQGIPVRTLEQLLHRLGREGIVVAERGPRGGYRLNLPAQQVSVRAIFDLFEPARPARPGRTGRTTDPPTVGADRDPAEHVWRQMLKAVEASLQAITLAELVRRFRKEMASPIRHRYTFHI